jgi:hypothetical protein
VFWRLDGDVFAMSWIERSGPLVSQPKRQGFGTTVVETMVKHWGAQVAGKDSPQPARGFRVVACPASNHRPIGEPDGYGGKDNLYNGRPRLIDAGKVRE